ncbi:MAG: DUF3179 domain-containing protein [Candidatus Hydrogenedentes bacterium]|nr:DUF3179 domain-containing protein [Candidatus Hydrogenedentota bacterium]
MKFRRHIFGVLALLALAGWFVQAAKVGRGGSPFISGRAEATASSRSMNGFDLSNASIPIDEILRGGPPRDGIPAILHPKFVPVGGVDYLRDTDRVVGFVQDGIARAYPLRILVWHELVNDTVGGTPIVVTYCPLCGTSMIFRRDYSGKELTFGVSGLLYQSDVLMYDHRTESLWSQLKMQCISGSMLGTELTWLPAEEMTWSAWKERYPDSEVLSTDTGFRRSYTRMPYEGYENTERLFFPAPKYREELGNKEWVVGVIVNGSAMAYPVKQLEKLAGTPLDDTLGGVDIRIAYDETKRWARVTRSDGEEPLPHVNAFWFAWQAFYPNTGLYIHP